MQKRVLSLHRYSFVCLCVFTLFGCSQEAQQAVTTESVIVPNNTVAARCFPNLKPNKEGMTFRRGELLSKFENCYGIFVHGTELLTEKSVDVPLHQLDLTQALNTLLAGEEYSLVFASSNLNNSEISDVLIGENPIWKSQGTNAYSALNTVEENDNVDVLEQQITQLDALSAMPDLTESFFSVTDSLNQQWSSLTNIQQKEELLDQIGLTANTSKWLQDKIEDYSIDVETKKLILARVEVEDSFAAKSITLAALKLDDSQIVSKAIDMLYSWNDISLAPSLIAVSIEHHDLEVRREAKELYSIFNEEISEAETVQ